MKNRSKLEYLTFCLSLAAPVARAGGEIKPAALPPSASSAETTRNAGAGGGVQEVQYVTEEIKGWTVFVNRSLLEGQRDATRQALELLGGQLESINKILPPAALAHLHTVPLWFNPLHRAGDPPKAEYHPGADGLRKNNRDARMAKAVEFTNVAIFAQECRRMPMFVLHELAHAYHDRVLGFGQPEILATYKAAIEGGAYKNVDRWNGTALSKADAYALTNAREYFAETTEAFFGRNDFQPFDRAELKLMDPQMHDLLAKLWDKK
jgi:hypothetical protein